MIRFWIATLHVSFENSQVMHLLTWIKMNLQIDQNVGDFWAIFKPALIFLYHNGKHGSTRFTVHRTVFSQCVRMCKPLSSAIAELALPCPLLSAQLGLVVLCAVGMTTAWAVLGRGLDRPGPLQPQPTPTIPTAPRCDSCMVTEHLQGQWLPHFPGQPVPLHFSPWEDIFLNIQPSL